jgi:micrococcal nuclease
MTAMLLILMIGQITGRVVDVYDGDSITIRTADDTVKIRLLHIDAPERGQAYGTRAKQALSEAVFGKTVTVHGTKKDRYKRLLGDVWIDGRSVNLEMVKGGLAWAYLEFKPPQEYIQAESIARGKRAGLWVDRQAVAPWEYRKSRRSP